MVKPARVQRHRRAIGGSIQATPATICGYSGSLRNWATWTGALRPLQVRWRPDPLARQRRGDHRSDVLRVHRADRGR